MKPLEEMGKYATVVIDPPWDSGGYRAQEVENEHQSHDYDVMSLDDIKALPVPSVCSDTFLFLWTTSRLLPDAFDVLKAWRASYCCTMVWHKPNGPKPTGYPIYNMEFILLAKVGRPVFRDTKGFWAVNAWETQYKPFGSTGGWGRIVDNSTKPEGFYDLLRRVTYAPRLDIFGRRRIAGFDSWGNEAPDEPALPDHYQEVLAI